MMIELWGGPQDGRLIEVEPGNSSLEVRVPVPNPTWPASSNANCTFRVGIYRARGDFNHGRLLYSWRGVEE